MSLTAEEITLIKGHGVSNPEVIFIIDHPHGDDYKTGYVLSGASGNTLKGLMKDVGIFIDSYYRTSLLKTEPIATQDQAKKRAPAPVEIVEDPSAAKSKGKKKKAAESRDYVSINTRLVNEQSKFIINEINDLNPNLLVPLGELSFNFLTGLRGITKFRGSVLQTTPLLNEPSYGLKRQYKVLPVLGPYPYLNQNYKMRMISKLDLSRILKYSTDLQPQENLIRPWVCKTPGEFRAFIERHYSKSSLLTFDIETFLQIPTCISFSFDGIEGCCVPLLDKSIDKDNRALLWMLVARLLASPIAKGNQNIKYDLSKLQRWGFYVENVVDDSMLAAGCIYCEFPKNLGFLTSIYTELPYFKDEGKEYDPNTNRGGQTYLYCAKDSIAAYQIITTQREETKELGVDYVYRQLIRCLPIYRRAEERGIRIDSIKREQLRAKYRNLYEIEVLKFRSLAGNYSLNPLSSVQMNTLVFKEFGYETGQYVSGTDEESLEWLINSAEHRSFISRDCLKTIINCRKLHKVIEIIELQLHPDERFRCEFNLAGTETGRSSGGKSTDQLLILLPKNKYKLKNLGHSLQTIGKHGFAIDGVTYGKDIRDMFVPTRGYRFVEVDLSGAEARVDRVLSGNYDMAVFDNPGIHKLTGSWLYNCEPSEIKKNTLVEVSPNLFVDRYHESKTVRHAGERNMKADRLVMMIGRTRTDCQELLNKFHGEQPEIRATYHRSIINAINETRNLIMPNGRRRDFFDRIDYSAYNEGISLYPQAIVSDQTKFLGIAPTFEEFEWAEMLVEAHDGCLAEVPIGREEEFAVKYKANIEQPIDFRFGSIKRDYNLIIPAEGEMGDSWGAMKGMKLG